MLANKGGIDRNRQLDVHFPWKLDQAMTCCWFPVTPCSSYKSRIDAIAEFSYYIPLRAKCANIVFFFFLIVCFTSFFMFSIAVLPHSPGVVYYQLLLRREIPGVYPFSFRIGIWDLFVHRGQKSYTPTAFGKLWTTPRVRYILLPKVRMIKVNPQEKTSF